MSAPKQLLLLDEFVYSNGCVIRFPNKDARNKEGRFRHGYGWIYFALAESAGRVKIGYTASDPNSRIKAIQCGCPFPVRLIAKIEGPRTWEQQAHTMFSKYRQSGEWFEFTEPIKDWLRYVRKVCKEAGVA